LNLAFYFVVLAALVPLAIGPTGWWSMSLAEREHISASIVSGLIILVPQMLALGLVTGGVRNRRKWARIVLAINSALGIFAIIEALGRVSAQWTTIFTIAAALLIIVSTASVFRREASNWFNRIDGTETKSALN